MDFVKLLISHISGAYMAFEPVQVRADEVPMTAQEFAAADESTVVNFLADLTYNPLLTAKCERLIYEFCEGYLIKIHFTQPEQVPEAFPFYLKLAGAIVITQMQKKQKFEEMLLLGFEKSRGVDSPNAVLLQLLAASTPLSILDEAVSQLVKFAEKSRENLVSFVATFLQLQN